jgi:integrase
MHRRSFSGNPPIERGRFAYSAAWNRQPEAVVFGHALLGTPLDPSKLTTYGKKALRKAGVPDTFRPWHGLRHTALTETAASGVPAMFVQAKAGNAQGSTMERYLHAARTSYPDAAELAEAFRGMASGTA